MQSCDILPENTTYVSIFTENLSIRIFANNLFANLFMYGNTHFLMHIIHAVWTLLN